MFWGHRFPKDLIVIISTKSRLGMRTEGFQMLSRSEGMTAVSREVNESIDRISVMLQQECSHYTSCYDYLRDSQNQENAIEYVTEGWRQKICEWSYEVVDHFGFDREVVSIAINYLDRVIANATQKTAVSVPRKEFQLVAVTTLFLAIKLHGIIDASEGAPSKLRINTFVDLSRGLFTIETLEATERSILATLQWHVNPPTTVAFIAYFLRLLPKTHKIQPGHGSTTSSIFEMARYLTELSICVTSFSFQFKSSEIAYAAILCSIEALRDTVTFPYESKVALFNSVAGVTSLTPNTANVRRAGIILMELCPSIFEHPEALAGLWCISSTGITGASGDMPSEGGNKSPVCAYDVHIEEFIPAE
jgi:lipoyl(octanoyl) transferase